MTIAALHTSLAVFQGRAESLRLWLVVRRGRRSGTGRILFQTPDQQRAAARFDKEHLAMRQGLLALISPVGEIDRVAHYPSLFWRW